MTLSLIIAISVTSFLLLHFVYKWDKEDHIFLHVLGSFFFIFMLLLVPKAALDHQNDCEIVVANETVVGNTTTYGHAEFCVTNPNKTETIFYKLYMGFVYVFVAYMFVYLSYVLLIKKMLEKWGIVKPKPRNLGRSE